MAPLLTLAMPVRNGQRFIESALESILAQSFDDYELLIVDNASTDATPAICKRFAGSDRRIRYVRNPVDLGAGGNFNRCVELASGRLFKWCAHDDVIGPGYLEHCVRALAANPRAVTAYGPLIQVDAEGAPTGYVERPLPPLDGASPAARFRMLMHRQGLDAAIFGVHRLDVLRSTSLHRPYYGSDCALLAELALLGPFVHVPEAVLYSRDHPNRSVNLPTEQRLVWQAPVDRRANAHEFSSRIGHLFAIGWHHRGQAPVVATGVSVLVFVLHPLRLARVGLEAVGTISPGLRMRLRVTGLSALQLLGSRRTSRGQDV